jgi:hypothetical protein
VSQITIAASETAFNAMFAVLRDRFVFSTSKSGDFGPFTAAIAVQVHLDGGTVDLRADNTVQVKEVDIKWDTLDLSFGFDIPELCVGGNCIIPTPFGCAVRLPRFCLFSSDPDISITLPLGGIVTSEVSATGSLAVKYAVNSARPAGMNDWDAQDAVPSLANQWQVFLDPQFVDVDVFDIADIVGDLLDTAFNTAIDGLLGWLPGWARTLIRRIIGPIVDLVREILDIGDDIQEWISDLLNVSFGLVDLLAEFLAEHFAAESILQIEDPYPILRAQPPLVAVNIPIRNLAVHNDADEMILEANVG